MTIYSKFCIICSKNFQTLRINTLYCSKKCRNRTRYLPSHLVNSLIQRNALFTTKANKYTNMIDEKQPGGYVPDGATHENPLGKDYSIVLGEARLEAERRGIKIKGKLADVTKENLKYINKQDPLGNADGFGVGVVGSKEQENEQKKEENK